MITGRVPSPAEIQEHLKVKGQAPWKRPTLEQEAKKALISAEKKVEDANARANKVIAKVERKLDDVARHAESLSTELRRRDRMTPSDLRNALNQLFDTYDFSPAEELVGMLMDKGHEHYIKDTRLRVTVLSELQSYVMPKLKSTEIKGEVEHKHTVVVVRYGEDGVVRREEAPVLRGREAVTDVEVVSTTTGGNHG